VVRYPRIAIELLPGGPGANQAYHESGPGISPPRPTAFMASPDDPSPREAIFRHLGRDSEGGGRRPGAGRPRSPPRLICIIVESRCDAVSTGLAYLLPALSVAGVSLASPLIRFHIPLIKPGRRFSRTRLSDKAVLIFCFTRSPTNNRR
jgi:hypothetical protein